MISNASLENILEDFTLIIQNRSMRIIIGCAFIVVLALVYTLLNIGVNTDTADMISPNLDWSKEFIAHKNAFPQYVDNLIVVVDSENASQKSMATTYIENKLHEKANLFKDIYNPRHNNFFNQN